MDALRARLSAPGFRALPCKKLAAIDFMKDEQLPRDGAGHITLKKRKRDVASFAISSAPEIREAKETTYFSPRFVAESPLAARLFGLS